MRSERKGLTITPEKVTENQRDIILIIEEHGTT